MGHKSRKMHWLIIIALTMFWLVFPTLQVSSAEPPPQIAWNVTFDSGDYDSPSGVAIGPDGHPVVTGVSLFQGRAIWRTIKYSEVNGAVLWNVTFDSGATEIASAVAVGPDGNPVVVGYLDGGRIRTIKYDGATGAILWNVTSGGTHNGVAVGIGSDGNPVVAGFFTVIKYDGATGAILWTQTPPSGFFLSGVAVGPDGDPVVAGDGCGGSGCSIVFKLRGANGEYIWTTVADGGAEGVAVGADGHPVVGGSSCNPGCDFRATKLDGATGGVLWKTASDAGPGEPFGGPIAVGPDGNPVQSGSTGLELPNGDIRTIKYDGATGTILWNVTFDSGGNDAGRGVAIGSDNKPVVAGVSCNPGCDFRVIKYEELSPADLAIGKRGASTVRSGANLSYGIGVANLGPNDATGVVVRDPVPAGTTFVSAQFAKGSCTVSSGGVSCTVSQPPTPCTFSNGVVTCRIGTLAPFSSTNPTGAGILLVVHVTASRGATIINTATVSASNPDPKPANNSATATTSVR